MIVGGESGPGFRPMKAEWAREVRDLCIHSGVAFFFKRVGGRAVFWGAIVSQSVIFILYFTDMFDFSYLYYNMIGCVGCIAVSIALQFTFQDRQELPEP